jgi:phage shock protein A
MLKQLVLDMENQLLQVKTQVAIAIADEHLLSKKMREHEEKAVEWKRKAELAVRKKNDDLARAAIERSLSNQQMAAGFLQQLEDQRAEANALRQALQKLDQKLSETRSRCDMLIAEHRRARTVGKAHKARANQKQSPEATFDRMKSRIIGVQADNAAQRELASGDSLEDRFAALEREDQIEALLLELKEQHLLTNGDEPKSA